MSRQKYYREREIDVEDLDPTPVTVPADELGEPSLDDMIRLHLRAQVDYAVRALAGQEVDSDEGLDFSIEEEDLTDLTPHGVEAVQAVAERPVEAGDAQGEPPAAEQAHSPPVDKTEPPATAEAP